MKEGTQEYDALMYFQSGETLTQTEALFKFGIGRLAAVVFNLKKLGYDIITEMVPVKKKNGRVATVARYRLRSEDNG